MTRKLDLNRRPNRNTLFRSSRSVLYQLLAGLEGSARRRVQTLAANAALREHKQMLLKMNEALKSLARDREERLAGKERIENREAALSKETEHA